MTDSFGISDILVKAVNSWIKNENCSFDYIFSFSIFFFLAHLSVLPEQSIVGELIVWFG